MKRRKVQPPCRWSASTDSDVKVTDHAIIRYLERVENMDIDKIAKLMLSQPLIRAVHEAKNGRFPLPGTDHEILVRDRVVVTVQRK